MDRILIAEDESAIANLIRTALDGPDYHCGWGRRTTSPSPLS